MAEVSSSSLKRTHPDADDGRGDSQKRPRSNNASPAGGATNGSAAIRPDVQKMLAEARAKASAVALAAKLRGATTTAAPSGLPATSPAAPSAGMSKIEQLKARVAAAVKGGSSAAGTSAAASSTAASTQRPTPSNPSYRPPELEDGFSRAHGGLDVGLHPALLGEVDADGKSALRMRAMQPKFATTMANRRTESPVPLSSKSGKAKKPLDLSGPSAEETRNNPYFDMSLGGQTATPKVRHSRQLVFNQKGKYIQQATALRRQAALEQMKKRIAESSRRAGIDEDLDTEKAFLVEAPPEIEWWDEGLVTGSDYSNISDPSNLKIDTPDSIITVYIQHPILIEPPQDKHIPAPKPMFLTPQEQAKLRRQRRMADLKEVQAKIRLGLEPAPPPKVKKSNLMRVLGEEAVKDPTAVEARVNAEIAARERAHLEANEARKLSKEQRHEKLSKHQDDDAARGVHAAVYRIDTLANGRHRFKVSKNAEQNALTGVCILNPKFCLVVVEGGQHSMRMYRKLMLQRIDWAENSPTAERATDGGTAADGVSKPEREALQHWLRAEDESGNLKDLSLNRCTLVWEGEVKNRGFRKWAYTRTCETDAAAKEILAKAKYENFWTLAKSMK
ncbi:MAG: hypothetical protein M1825_002533 [Sarcosagium campestre]|nr:MAG: hypothetical protein M1825_002533 [Sarcosagium campestre]